jgi:hypothetical protein
MDPPWDACFSILKDFHTLYGRFPINFESHRGVKISYWFNLQIRKFKSGGLQMRQMKMLDGLNKFWHHNVNPEYCKRWNMFFNFVEANWPDEEIHNWLVRQRNSGEITPLTEKSVQKLKAIVLLYQNE